ncbi:UPF0725 protein [Arabidopsis thaliana]
MVLETPVCSPIDKESSSDDVQLNKPPKKKRKLDVVYPPRDNTSSSSDVKPKVPGYCGVKAIGCNRSDELLAEVALHSYNSHTGTNLELMTVTQVMLQSVAHINYHMILDAFDPANNSLSSIEICLWDAAVKNNEKLRLVTTFCSLEGSGDKGSQWDPNGVDVLYTGVMPKWLDDGALSGSEKLHYYEVNDSDLQENKWLHLYAQVGAYSKWDLGMVKHFPLEIKKVVVQTMEDDIESNLKLKSSNAIFYITFTTSGGVECACIIRQTRDGRPQHMCLEINNVEMDK